MTSTATASSFVDAMTTEDIAAYTAADWREGIGVQLTENDDLAEIMDVIAELVDVARNTTRIIGNTTPMADHDICDSETCETLRSATIEECAESRAAGPEGHIEIDGRRVYVD